MPSRDTPNPPGAQRRGVAEPLARRERRVKAKAAPAGARSASLEAAQAPCKTLDAQHSRFVPCRRLVAPEPNGRRRIGGGLEPLWFNLLPN